MAKYEPYDDWEPVSIFLSHEAKYGPQIMALKEELEYYGTSCFVAHEDIAPSRVWLKEINRSIKECDALVALLTPDFHQSLWTDQEIGIALGRKKPVIPVSLGTIPYGFMGDIQALKGDLNHPRELAEAIVRVLLEHDVTCASMQQALVDAHYNASSFMTSRRTSKVLSSLDEITQEQYDLLYDANEGNDQVYDAGGVYDSMEEFLENVEIVEVEE